MNTSKFRSIPEYHPFEIPFILEEAPLLDWLNTLSNEESKNACFQLLRWLQALNSTAIAPQKRLNFLILTDEYLRSYINHLKGVCWDVGYPLTIEEKVYAEVVTWNYLLLAKGFFIVSQESPEKEAAAMALSKALIAKGQAQLQIAAVYALPPEGFWQDTYQMFALAQKKQLLPIKIRKQKTMTLATFFKKLFVFQACDTNQFHARDMQTIFYFLDSVAHKIRFKKYEGDLTSFFSFDVSSDIPPKKYLENTHTPSSTRYYFAPIVVALEIYATLRSEKPWKDTLKPVNSTLFNRVIKTLSLGQRRKYTRIKDEYDVRGIIGFEDIINFLRKTAATSLSTSQQLPFQAIKEATADLKMYIQNKDIGVSMHNETALAQSLSYHSIWHTPTALNTDDNIKAVDIKDIHIFDSSVKGYLLYWNNTNIQLRAKIGDVFGIISKDKKRLEIALIRRISINENNHFRFGAEVIGFESEVVYICHPDHTDHYIWAIFIPRIKGLVQNDTLIFSTENFTVGDKIHIYRGQEKRRGLIPKEQHTNSRIFIGELSYSENDKRLD
ncbi:MAG: hypothetical protein KAG26_05255 [Methylococcales bacterium]|nr:hypothetical protein [Methylococcales bacterium]